MHIWHVFFLRLLVLERQRFTLSYEMQLFRYRSISSLFNVAIVYWVVFYVVPECACFDSSESLLFRFGSNIENRANSDPSYRRPGSQTKCTDYYCEGDLANTQVIAIIQRNMHKLSLFNQRRRGPPRFEGRSYRPAQDEEPDDGIHTRKVAHTPSGEACTSRTRLIQPTSAKRASDLKFQAILNTNDFVQYEFIEVCTSANGNCSNVHTDQGLRAYCRQAYSYRKLISYNADGEPEVETFLLESGCSCFVGRV